MNIILPLRADVAEALDRYASVSPRLADEFAAEFTRVVNIAAANPTRYHVIKPGIHRANFSRFPYHAVYRVIETGIRVTLVRHHRRAPHIGMERE